MNILGKFILTPLSPSLVDAPTNNGVMTIGNGGTSGEFNGGTSGEFSGDMVNNGTVTFNRSDDISYLDSMSGTGSLIKSGAGSLTLSANTYTGATVVSGGTLKSTGSLASTSLTIGGGGTFDMSDANASVVFASLEASKGSTLNTGATALDMSDKTLIFDLDGVTADGSSVVLTVSGPGGLLVDDSTTVDIKNVTRALKKDDEVVLASVDDASTFTDQAITSGRREVSVVLNETMDQLIATLLNSASFVDATNDFLGAPGNANIQNGDSYLDWLSDQPFGTTPGMDALDDFFASVTDNLSPGVGARELERWFGAYGAYANHALSDNANRFRIRWRGQNHSFLNTFVFRDLLSGEACAGVSSVSDLASPYYSARCTVPSGQSRIWAGGFGTWTEQKRRSDLSGYKYDSQGLVLGYEHTRDRLNFGIAAAYSRGDLKVNDLAYKNKTDIFNMALYAAYAHESGFYAEGGLGYGHAWNDYNVNMSLGGSKKAKYGSDLFSADLELGYIARLPHAFNVIPSIGIRYDHTRNGSWTEKLAGNTDPNLTPNRFSSGSDNALGVPVGVRMNKVFRYGCEGTIIPEFRASYVYQAVRSSSSITSSFAGAPGGMKMRGVDTSRSHWRFGVGVSGQINNRVDFRVDYDYETRSGYKGHNVNASVGVSF